MRSLNVVTGLPRSGSTLLCNILNQNPIFYASSTSILPGILAGMSHAFSNSPEITGALAKDEAGTTSRLRRVLRGVADSWYEDRAEEVVFDKSRGWSVNALMLKQLYPDARLIVTVRDLRAVFGSIEKQHRKNPIFDHAAAGMQKTLYTRANEMFSPNSLIGSAIVGVEDLMRRKPEGVLAVTYEALARDPKDVMSLVYQKLGESPFEHDFTNVQNTAEDLDALYHGKFEHKGEGPVRAPDLNEWKQFVSPDLASLIMKRYPFYNETFRYDL